MLSNVARGNQVPVTPSVLEWALEQAGKSHADLAAETNTDISIVKKWLAGMEQPTLTRARLVAKAVRRPLAFLMWPEPPAQLAPMIAFRAPTGTGMRDLNPNERRLIRQAQRVQRAVSWLRSEFEEKFPELPKVKIGADTFRVASQVRELLGVSVEEQCQWGSLAKALKGWRERVESLGVLVFSLPLGPDSCRGMMLPDEHAPVIILNTAYNHAARIFSLFHELGHVISQTGSACEHSLAAPNKKSDRVERWCEEFSTEVLLPWRAVEMFLRSKGHSAMVTDLGVARMVGRKFNVSLSAVVLRLIGQQRATWSLWTDIPSTIDDKKKGGQAPEEPRTTPVVRLGEYGRPATELLVRGVEAELLDRSQASSYLRVDDVAFADLRERVTAESKE